jgi:glyoxylase I family protein
VIRVPIKTDGISHIRLTVTDIARSRAFYEAVFGWPVPLEVRPDANGTTREQLGFR